MKRRFSAILILACSVGSGCDNPAEVVDPGGASYSTSFDPGRVVHATERGDRLVTHALLGLGRSQRDFDLSINLLDDCSRSGGGYEFWEVMILGTYRVDGTALVFMPDSPQTPGFSGTHDRGMIQLVLPARADSLAPQPIVLELGPRVSY